MPRHWYGIPGRHFVTLPWPRCKRGTVGALFNGSTWRCPPFGPGPSIHVPDPGTFIEVRRSPAPPRVPWRPWWERKREADQPGRTVFRGGPDGVEVL